MMNHVLDYYDRHGYAAAYEKAEDIVASWRGDIEGLCAAIGQASVRINRYPVHLKRSPKQVLALARKARMRKPIKDGSL